MSKRSQKLLYYEVGRLTIMFATIASKGTFSHALNSEKKKKKYNQQTKNKKFFPPEFSQKRQES